MDAVELLVDDHRAIEQKVLQFRELVQGKMNPKEKRCAVIRLSNDILCHLELEQELFFSFARISVPATRWQPIDASLNELRRSKEVIDLIGQASDEALAQIVEMIWEHFEKHVRVEEEKLFPEVRASGMELERLASLMITRKALFNRRLLTSDCYK